MAKKSKAKKKSTKKKAAPARKKKKVVKSAAKKAAKKAPKKAAKKAVKKAVKKAAPKRKAPAKKPVVHAPPPAPAPEPASAPAWTPPASSGFGGDHTVQILRRSTLREDGQGGRVVNARLPVALRSSCIRGMAFVPGAAAIRRLGSWGPVAKLTAPPWWCAACRFIPDGIADLIELKSSAYPPRQAPFSSGSDGAGKYIA